VLRDAEIYSWCMQNSPEDKEYMCCTDLYALNMTNRVNSLFYKEMEICKEKKSAELRTS
jgi:hypothetical protein